MSYSDNHVRNAALELIEKFSLSSPPVDPEFIAEQIGAKDNLQVRYVHLDERSASPIRGWYDFRDSVIAINIDDEIEEKLFTIAHELGHYVLHQEYSRSEKYVPRINGEHDNVQEIEANEFAVRLLLPEPAFQSYDHLFDDNHLREYFVVKQSTVDKARVLYA